MKVPVFTSHLSLFLIIKHFFFVKLARKMIITLSYISSKYEACWAYFHFISLLLLSIFFFAHFRPTLFLLLLIFKNFYYLGKLTFRLWVVLPVFFHFYLCISFNYYAINFVFNLFFLFMTWVVWHTIKVKIIFLNSNLKQEKFCICFYNNKNRWMLHIWKLP